jgi:hypothetical protein
MNLNNLSNRILFSQFFCLENLNCEIQFYFPKEMKNIFTVVNHTVYGSICSKFLWLSFEYSQNTYQASSLIIENPNISSKQPSAILISYQFWSALATNSPVGFSYLILVVFSEAVTVEALRKMLAASMHKIEILL